MITLHSQLNSFFVWPIYKYITMIDTISYFILIDKISYIILLDKVSYIILIVKGGFLGKPSQSKELLHSLPNLAGLIKHLDKVHEAFQNLSLGDSWRLNPILAILVEVGQVLNGAGLGSLHAIAVFLQCVCLLKALNTLLQLWLIQVAVLVSSLNEAGGCDDKVLVALKLLQILTRLV